MGGIDCKITSELSDFILEPLDEFSVGVIPSRPYNKSRTRGKLCLMNLTMRAHIYRQGQLVATAMPATEAGIPKASVRQVGTEGSPEVPTHIKGLLEDIQINAPPDVRNEAVRLITQYSDVFAVRDLDKGEFTAIEQQLQALESQGRKRKDGKCKRYEYCVCKTITPMGRMVQCDQCKDWFLSVPHLRVGPRGVTQGQRGFLYRRVTEIHLVSLAGLAENVNITLMLDKQLRDAPVP